jgi:hypothetical protein
MGIAGQCTATMGYRILEYQNSMYKAGTQVEQY